MTDKDIRQQAYYWVTEMSAGDVAADTIAEFDAWYAEDKRHSQAYNDVEQMFFGLADIPALAAMECKNQVLANEQPSPGTTGAWFTNWLRSPVVWSGAVACLLVAAVLLLQPFSSSQPNALQYSSPVAESRNYQLEDGSQVILGASSKITVDYSSNQRLINLIRGQAFFTVAKDPKRPFIVRAGVASAEAVGTRFDVRRGVTETTVGVEEGLVDARFENSEPLRLSAGQQVLVSKVSGIGAVQTLDEVGQWRQGRLSYVNVKLVEMIADANRYHPKNIVLVSDEIADLSLTAVFRTDQIDEMLNTLTTAFPIETVIGADGTILVKPRRKEAE